MQEKRKNGLAIKIYGATVQKFMEVLVSFSEKRWEKVDQQSCT